MTALTYAAAINNQDVHDIVQKAPGAKEYPNEDAIWLLREMTIDVAPSGAFTVHERKLLKILTIQGLSRAQWEIPYDKATESLDVPTARTLLNGHTFSVDPTQVVENAVYQGVAWYDSMVVRRFPLPAAMPGATLDVETFCQHRVPRVPGAFSTRLSLRQREPVCEARYTIHVPLDQHLTIHWTGENPPPIITHEDGTTREYSWSLRNLPAFNPDELSCPPTDDIIPSLRITSLTSWQPVAAWYDNLTQGKAAVTDDLRRVVQQRTAGCATLTEKIDALYQAVRDIPYVAVEMGDLSDIPHSADEVARQNYGDCKDKATLLRALLNAIGVSSHYVLVRTTDRGKLDRTLYGADEFNHVILVARTPDGDRYLDPSMTNVPIGCLPPGVDGADALIIDGNGTLVTLPASTAQQNTTLTHVEVQLQRDMSASGHVTLTMSGQNAMLQRNVLFPIPKEKYREALEGYLSSRLGPEVAITSVDITGMNEPEHPLVITAAFSSPHYLQPAGNQVSSFFPSFARQPNAFRTVTTRQFPFVQDIASSMQLDVSIQLPDGLRVSHLPAPVQYTSPIGQYRDEAHVEKQAIHYTCSLTINRGIFPAESLNEISRWSSILAAEGRNQLQFFLQP
ncbi:MAG TPA: DUF3857 domain-containing protein [Armatimonadota bacterium]|nr:DUF3857 domain-containing protein [Armatimonadota bacterium]